LKALSFSKPSITLTKELPNESMMAKCNMLVVSYQIGLASFGLVINFLYWNSFTWTDEPSVVNGTFSKEGTISSTLFKCL
jgi:cation-transporting ATPase 13A3/4/5